MHIEVIGRGPDLVMLHGWAMHGGIWHGVRDRLAAHFRLHIIDLPGHGHSPPQPYNSLTALADLVAEMFPRPVNVLGWSLGGVIAMQWGLTRPTAINRLVLVASSPCFAQRDNWVLAMKPEVLEKFSVDLQSAYEPTLRRFLALQALGGEVNREVLRDLTQRLFERGRPDPVALAQGLALLQDVDLRPQMDRLDVPTLLVYGERDSLTPAPVAHWLDETMPDTELLLLRQSAHTPFISHPVVFTNAVIHFLKSSKT